MWKKIQEGLGALLIAVLVYFGIKYDNISDENDQLEEENEQLKATTQIATLEAKEDEQAKTTADDQITQSNDDAALAAAESKLQR